MLCDCGDEYEAPLSHLMNGAIKSCGCLLKERQRAGFSPGATSHGLSHHPLYATWYDMLQRCENPADKGYYRYGGRGINVCDRWHDVATFISDIEHWLGSRPSGMTLDRIQNDHDYRLDNVRWASRLEQANNRGTHTTQQLTYAPASLAIV